MGEDKQPSASRLEEALHPRIGNSAGWSNASHESQLREIDPTKKLESHLVDDEQTADVLKRWESDMEGNGVENAALPEEISPVGSTNESPGMQVEASPLPATEEVETAPAKSRKKQPKDKTGPGKRVRKLAVKEEEKTAENNRKLREQFTPASDESLTPFTQWLKGLKGSEYVHPFEDDFAFRQSEGPVREGISETYADLLAAQGYRDQAIDMYTRLMEKFPEKSRFFAAKIDALS